MHATPLLTISPLPVVVQLPAQRTAAAAVEWAREHSEELQTLAAQVGVVLIRGFEIGRVQEFRALCEGIEPDLRDYTGGDSPRTDLADKVYTSTEYDSSLEVFLHNELSYAGWSPRLVFFGCLVAAREGGETQIADGREIYRSLPSDIVKRFEEHGIAYLQHLWDGEGQPGVGKSWQETFGTTDRLAAEDYLRRSNMTWQWTDFGIRTRSVHPSVVTDPNTGAQIWRNQADQWHRSLAGVKTSFGGDGDARFDPLTAGEETLGNHVTFGDGSEIDVDDLKAIRRVAQSAEVTFPWEAGDVMVIDNFVAMHGRKPYVGPRQVVVAMA